MTQKHSADERLLLITTNQAQNIYSTTRSPSRVWVPAHTPPPQTCGRNSPPDGRRSDKSPLIGSFRGLTLFLAANQQKVPLHINQPITELRLETPATSTQQQRRPLSLIQQTLSSSSSPSRCCFRVKHVFGFQTQNSANCLQNV